MGCKSPYCCLGGPTCDGQYDREKREHGITLDVLNHVRDALSLAKGERDALRAQLAAVASAHPSCPAFDDQPGPCNCASPGKLAAASEDRDEARAMLERIAKQVAKGPGESVDEAVGRFAAQLAASPVGALTAALDAGLTVTVTAQPTTTTTPTVVTLVPSLDLAASQARERGLRAQARMYIAALERIARGETSQPGITAQVALSIAPAAKVKR